MINETFDRLVGVAKKEDIFVVTNEEQVHLVETMTEDRFAPHQILAESAARNTAACIGYAAMEILKKHGDGIMCIVPSDHFIECVDEFQRILKQAVEVAEQTDKLITIGITPTFPSTGYGYIQYNQEEKVAPYSVQEFVEKPDVDTAKHYLANGGYLWNSGMFVWKASVILEQFKLLLPDIYECLEKIAATFGTPTEQEQIRGIYPTIPKISIDYGIMERAKEVVVIPGDFGWNDVGSYDALESILPKDDQGNVSYGDTILLDTKNCIAYGKTKTIATIGVENLIIAQTEDAVLVCRKDEAQNVKKIVELLNN